MSPKSLGLRSAVLAGCLIAALTASASAQTLYVNERGGSSTCLAPGINACPTIKEAIEQARGLAPPNTIEVETESPGETAIYKENLELNNVRDKELTITGEEAGVIIKGHIVAKSPATSLTLSNLQLQTEGASAAFADTGVSARLLNVTVIAESVKRGVEANGAPLTVEGGSVTLESSEEFAVYDSGGALRVNGAKIENGAGGIGSESGGIASGHGSLSVTGATVINEGSPKETQFGIVAEGDSSATIRKTRVVQGSNAIGVLFENAPPTVEGLEVEMQDEASKVEAIDSEGPGTASFSGVQTSGKWSGAALTIIGDEARVSDSHIISNISKTSPALRYVGEGTSNGLLLQRSVVEAPIKAPGSLEVIKGNGTLDSSEVLGGHSGVVFEALGAADLLTVAASTIGPFNGLLSEAPGPVGIEAKASGTGGAATAKVEGSILIESQTATIGLGDTASVTCSDTAVPSQIQTANSLTHAGEISCPAGTSGNTNATGELASLFAEPLHNYNLAASSSAVDSVPAGAVALPFGFTSSSTDLAGAPRVVDGNGDCLAVQDKGALELQGHAAPCPPAPSPPAKSAGPPAGVISALTVSPSAFKAAPKGATISKAKYGAKVSWHDSQAATTTFTVLRLTAGRKQGKSCREPSKSNRHGRRCTLLVKVGTFAHTDKPGPDSLHFSGRLKGRKLAAGSYTLRAVAHDAAGNGKAASRGFKVL